jgi:hypothetical protein
LRRRALEGERMKNKCGLFFLALSLSFMVSCATTSSLITQDALSSIRRGMPRGEFAATISPAPSSPSLLQGKKGPRSAFAVEYESVTYPVEIYDMQTGTKTETVYHPGMTVYHPIYPHGGYTTYTPGYTTTVQVPVTADYVFVFDQAGLMYWGFINELQKDDDQLISALAPLILAEYDNQVRMANEKRQKELAEQSTRQGR